MDYSGSVPRQPSNMSHRKGKLDESQQQQQQQQQPQYAYIPQPQFQQQSQMYDPNVLSQPQPPPPPPYYGQDYGQMPAFPPGNNYYMGGGGGPPDFNLASSNFINDPMANMAMAYGQTLVGQGKHIVDQKLEKYVSVSKLKYYFGVDTSYVRRKLLLILFPYANTDWSIKYQQDEPVAPRYEANAPDLYIPVMAFVTFILTAGLVLGTQNKFSPEQLGIQASSLFVWLFLEILVIWTMTYVGNIQTSLGYLDFIAYCSYKYVGMIVSVCVGLVFYSVGYYISLAYTSASLCFFLVKTLRIQILPKSAVEHHPTSGNKRRMYLLLFIAVVQPVVMFWLTWRLIPSNKEAVSGNNIFERN